MKQRRLGANGPWVGEIGLGSMSFAGAFGETDLATSHRCLDAAVEAGITFLDTANVYGMGRSEQVLGAWANPAKSRMHIATKGGIVREARRCNNDPAHLRTELEGSLRRLGVDHVALYYIHRRDQTVPLEEVIGALKDFEDEGKIGGYGLSEVAPYTLRRAHALHPCRAVQSEYSLWTRQPELGMLQACADLGVAFVPFSPVARGVLTDTPPDIATMAEGDFRLEIPRFSPENYPLNLAATDPFRRWARDNGWTAAAAALAWVLAQGDHLIPIPATRSTEHLTEWLPAADRALSDREQGDIARVLPPGFAFGDRYSDNQMKAVERYC